MTGSSMPSEILVGLQRPQRREGQAAFGAQAAGPRQVDVVAVAGRQRGGGLASGGGFGEVVLEAGRGVPRGRSGPPGRRGRARRPPSRATGPAARPRRRTRCRAGRRRPTGPAAGSRCGARPGGPRRHDRGRGRRRPGTPRRSRGRGPGRSAPRRRRRAPAGRTSPPPNTAHYFDGWDELDGNGGGGALEELWVGRRPLTPDGLPILDQVPPFDNLFVATGHSMLGITLAPASGQALADYVLTGQRPTLLEPFRLRRFARRRRR